MPIALILVFVFMIILADFVEKDMLKSYGLLAGAAYIILNILHRNLSNFNAFIVINRNTANFPLKQMSMVNGFIMSILITICGGVMLICANKYVYGMFEAVTGVGGKLGAGILRFIFALIGSGESDDTVITGAQGGSGGAFLEPGETNELVKSILDAIAYVFMVVFAILIVIGIAVLIIRLVRNLKGQNDLEGDVKEFITPEGISIFNLKHKKREKEDKAEQANLKARKLYKNMVRRNAGKMGKHIAGTMFPADISEQYVYSMRVEATSIYEKARYSNKAVSKEELELLKNIQKVSKPQDFV